MLDRKRRLSLTLYLGQRSVQAIPSDAHPSQIRETIQRNSKRAKHGVAGEIK
jgi:hypothetical protein